MSALAMTIAATAQSAWAEGTSPGASSAPVTFNVSAMSSPLDGGSCEVSSSMVLPPARLANALGAAAGAPPPLPGALGVSCSLAYQRGRRGGDCEGWHTIDFQTTNTSGNEKVTAELVAYDLQGIVIKTLPVKDGDSAHLASKLSPSDFKMVSNLKRKTHEVFAPIPMLRVTVEDEGQKATAYCSNIPWLQVIEPKGSVVIDEDAGNVTNIVAAAPRVDSSTLDFKVDGVHILSPINAWSNSGGPINDLDSCTASDPCQRTLDINMTMVTVSNLVVDIAPDIGNLASNTIRFSLENQACGGHVYVLNGEYLPTAVKNPTSASCHVDNVLDNGLSSIFGISIDSPMPGDKLLMAPIFPVHVVGEVCSGRQIVSASLNGEPQDVSMSPMGQVCVLGDGENSGDSCTVPLDAYLGETDIENDLVNGPFSQGTFDLGTNRLVAAAADDLGNRTFKRVVFTAGDTAAPGIEIAALLQQSAQDLAIQNQLKDAVMPQVQQVMNVTSATIENAFVVGITAEATQKLFNQLCTAPLPAMKPDGTPNDPELVGLTPGQIFQKQAKAALEGKSVQKVVNVVCAPDVTVTTSVTNVTVSDAVTCDVTFFQDQFHVTLGLPDISLSLSAYGRSGDYPADDSICANGAKIEGTFTGSITGIKLDFDVTEGQLMGNPPPDPVFTAGATAAADGNVDASWCVFSAVCAFGVTVFTLGQVDLLSAEFDFDYKKDFSKELAGAEPDPVRLNEIKVDEEVVANFDQKLSGAVSSVEIDTTGIRAGLRGSFATTAVDAEIDPTLGAVLTPEPALPTFAQASATAGSPQDIFIGLADDTINMLFASMTAAGKLKGECTDTGKTVGSLLDLNKNDTTNAADCDTIVVDTGHPALDATAQALARGTCYGIINAGCETIDLNPGNPNDLNTASAQGVCHALQGHDCNNPAVVPLAAGPLAASTEKGLCTSTPNPNIHGNQSLLFCARQELPPRMLLADDTGTIDLVEATLRLNDLSVALVLDRTSELNPGQPDGMIDVPLAQVPGCFSTGNPTNNDCNLFATCLDLNVDFQMGNQECTDPMTMEVKPGFVNSFSGIELTVQERGVVCGAGGSTAGTDSAVLQQAQGDDTVKIDLTERAKTLAPPICGAGLTLGGFVTCESPTIVTMDAGAQTPLQDFIGITCTVP